MSGRPEDGMLILVINCGSTSLKYKLYEAQEQRLSLLAAASVPLRPGEEPPIAGILGTLPAAPDAVAHRVVHGGDRFTTAVQVDDEVLRTLAELTPLDPLHNGPALRALEITRTLGVPIVAAFDTAFFADLPPLARRYALPRMPGVHRYGFHGWSHRSVMNRLAALSGEPEPTFVSLHLGSGCSAAAVRRGKPVDTSMGYSPLEGLIMGTRAGDVDPGVLLHLIQEGWNPDRLGHLLYHEAGLLALGGTADMRELLSRSDSDAHEAVEIFCYRAVKYVGAYLAALEGETQALVFTGGIGENAPEIRERICRPLEWAGLRLDSTRNARGEEQISAGGSPLRVYAIRTDEESGIAEEALHLLRGVRAQ
jgi:acetate kinase